MEIERESAKINHDDVATRKDLEAKIVEALSQMSTDELQTLIREMEANLSS